MAGRRTCIVLIHARTAYPFSAKWALFSAANALSFHVWAVKACRKDSISELDVVARFDSCRGECNVHEKFDLAFIELVLSLGQPQKGLHNLDNALQ